MLLLNNTPFPPNTLALPPNDITTFIYNETQNTKKCNEYSDTPTVTLPRESSLCVLQKEFAVIRPQLRSASVHTVEFVGSVYATTCHMISMQRCATGTMAFAHLDSANSAEVDIKRLLCEVFSDSAGAKDSLPAQDGREVHVQMVGGFEDPKGMSVGLTAAIIKALYRVRNMNVKITLCCVGRLNTTQSFNGQNGVTGPHTVNSAISISNGHMVRAEFLNVGPMVPLRQLRCHGFSQLTKVYDSDRPGVYVIEPFTYFATTTNPLLALAQNNPSRYLESCSSSPWCEHPEFVNECIASFLFAKENPHCGQVFQNKASIIVPFDS